MTKDYWEQVHHKYTNERWITIPTLFAHEALTYFPKGGTLLDLGAGQGQDSRFFAEAGYDVISTDFSESAVVFSQAKTPEHLRPKIAFQVVDLAHPFPFQNAAFDVVYAHLSVHYFSHEITRQIFSEIFRVLQSGGILALMANSTSDPEFLAAKEIEPGLVEIDGIQKRFFSPESLKPFVSTFKTILLDDHGETHKDRPKGVHNLIRFVGRKP